MFPIPHQTRVFPQFGGGIVWTLLSFLAAPALVALEQPSKPAEVPVNAAPLITSIHQYWDLTPEQKSLPTAFRLECDVTYFDAEWKMLFIQDINGQGAYAPYGDNPFPFKAGQHIIATGTFVPPNADISFEHATITAQGPSRVVPYSIAGKVTQFQQVITKFVTCEGLVDHYGRVNPTHVQLACSVEGELVFSWILIDANDSLPDLRNAWVRIEGVYNPKIGPDGKLSSIEIMIPGLKHLTILNRLEDDRRFQLPVVAIETLPRLPADRLAHIVGQVKAQESGRYVRIRDESGQIDVLTGQTRLCAINEIIEAVGYPAINGTEWQLIRALFRPEKNQPAALAPIIPSESLRLAQQVRELSALEAMTGRPVWLTGVVTWSHPDSPFFFMQDASSGICVMRGKSTSTIWEPGRNLELHGVTAMGSFAPVVVASTFDKVSDLVLPQARQISLEYALTGAEEANWVEMRGYLRQIRRRDAWNELEVGTLTGDFVAVLPAQQDVSALVGAVIRLHGVCTANANAQRKLTGITLFVPGADYIQIEEPAPKNPFDVPACSLDSLGQFGTLLSNNRRVRVSGVVLHWSPGHSIHIADAGQTLLVLSRDQTPLEPGERIEAVGFPGRQGGRIALREAVYRKTGRDRQPEPNPIMPQQDPAPDLDGQLVSIKGTLIDTFMAGDLVRLTLQADNVIFEALFEKTKTNPGPASVPGGSVLSVTGVYELKFDEYGQPVAFQLRLRTPGDVKVITHPSWLTRARILAFAGALAVAVLLFIAWVVALRRRVRAQTGQIRDQMKRESQFEAELQRASKLESLGLLAGGIAHDFNNLLTVVMGNLSLARLDRHMEPESASSLRDAEKAVVRARDLTQQLLTFAKGGVPIRAAVNLPEVVREVAEFALRGSLSRCQFDIPDDLWPASVDKGQIGQVVQNIVINATQAMPGGGLIEITLRNDLVGVELGQVLAPGRYVKLTIADHGPGIPPEALQQIFDPYFTTKKGGSGLGLATVHSIVKKHLGHVSTESVMGQGTTFRIWLPAAESAPDPANAPATIAPPPAARVPVRILFMDDEELVLQVGCTMLRRIGYEVVAVTDGEAAVKEFARARQEGRPYALVILDLTVPGGMGGRQALEQLVKLDPAVRAIVSSGYSNDLVLSNYRAHGFRGMVSKPYDIADLAHAIERVLEGERA
ncbi:MAG TPA: ATP-binding protein [Opitutaceae bacterium]|nr:ATP-binding protein [Opitutaceae bacterium]